MNCYFKHSASFRDQVRASVVGASTPTGECLAWTFEANRPCPGKYGKIKLRTSAHDCCIGNAVLVWEVGFHRDGGPLFVVENFLVARKSPKFKVWVECSDKDLIAHFLHVPKQEK